MTAYAVRDLGLRDALDEAIFDAARTADALVIVHELVHLLVPNHGKVFKSFMHAYLPDWPERERLLREAASQQLIR